MKTIELVKKLEKIDGVKVYHKDYINVIVNEIRIASVGTLGSWVEIFNDCQDEVAKLLFEYYLTPLEEREEEKKYLLAINVANKKYYLLKNENKKDFHLVTTPYAYKTEFTQEEIDLLNFDLSKFIKEEVL